MQEAKGMTHFQRSPEPVVSQQHHPYVLLNANDNATHSLFARDH
jgi:hypothetical protein